MDGVEKTEEAKANGVDAAEKALDRLKGSEASEWLAAPPALVQCAKQASEKLFSLTASNFEKAPLSKLYTDRFDAEQIWQQIDLQSHPVLSYIRRRLKILEKVPIEDYFSVPDNTRQSKKSREQELKQVKGQAYGSEAGNEDEMEDDDEDADASEDGSDEMEDPESGSDSGDAGDQEDGAPKNPVEDDFFKISEMEKFLDRADDEEAGIASPSRNAEGGSDEEEDDDDLEDEEAGISDGHEDVERPLGFGEYDEFFGKDKKKRMVKRLAEDGDDAEVNDQELSEDETDDEGTAMGLVEEEKAMTIAPQDEKMSAHERRLQKTKKRVEQLEKANIDPKDWTQQGEVTAKKRPKNSALEVELDFEHNVRPPPVITEEVTASIEDMIKARIAEGRFDDIVRRTPVVATAPRERIELDESKSQKGLGEIYEAEYMQQTGLAVASTSTTDALKNEARVLFKALCGRLDSLSHFHFAPKQVIEDMEIRADVPALAMEEVAPLAVSDASMLAPEEVFQGQDTLKAEGELTPEERKRRRAQKKRKRKGERAFQESLHKKSRPLGSTSTDPKATPGLKIGYSSYSKSTKVFAQLDKVKDGVGKAPPKKDEKKPPHPSFLKL